MRLYLVQHGQAVAKELDPGRPLSAEGEQEVQQIARHMNKGGILLNSIYHSGKVRAHQTAEIFANVLLDNGEAEAIDGIKPNDSVEAFAKVVSKFKTGTMVVGHLPFMAKMVTYLITGREEPVIVAYQPGSVVCLLQDEEKQWRISWMLRPECI